MTQGLGSEALAEVVIAMMEGSDKTVQQPAGCLMVTSATQGKTIEPRHLQIVRDYRQMLVDKAKQVLERDRQSGRLARSVDPEGAAEFLVCVVWGTWLLPHNALAQNVTLPQPGQQCSRKRFRIGSVTDWVQGCVKPDVRGRRSISRFGLKPAICSTLFMFRNRPVSSPLRSASPPAGRRNGGRPRRAIVGTDRFRESRPCDPRAFASG